ncbi:cytochrome P450 monooxygenase [Stachybotrys elegans]|uniref:Cytochrome P450 monooxygenase n=1 Tax=Stachybotrys elegans TaxID=80388 RepID=A0A8K0WRQ4_9HYPO|nr:cytochrome P450 monooxygenase [Stachybotrys elegans]
MALSVPLLIPLVGLFAFFHFVIRPAVLSPLAKIPSAHWSTPISSLWILSARKRGIENQLLHDAHKKLGPVVRTGPCQLSVDGADALKIVYQGGFEKDPWYSVFDNYGVPCMFSARSAKDHSARKRMMANVYSKSYLQSSQAAKDQAKIILYQRLLPLLKESTLPQYKPNGIDVYSTFLGATMDFISAYIFGISTSTNFIQNKGYRGHWLELYSARHGHLFWSQELPSLTGFFKGLGVWLYPRWVDYANDELAAWNLDLCNKAEKYLSKEAAMNTEADEPVVLRSLNAGVDKETAANGTGSILYSTVIQQRRLSVASEVFDHILAGQETAGIALTYLSWEMSQRPELQEQLRAELLTLKPNFLMKDASLPDPKHLDALPLLHAIVMETLRLHAPIPGPQARQTPYPQCIIDGYEIPGGVRIAAAAHTLHLDERVFPKPLEWDPKRWIQAEATEEEWKARHRQFWAFGSGGRMCIGSNFALNEMKNIVAAIYTNFTSHIVDDDGIEQVGGYSGGPVSGKLILRFQEVNA